MLTRRRLLAVVLLSGATALILALSPGLVRPWFTAALASPWFPVLLVGCYLVRPFLGLPITLLSALVGFRYGVALGVPIALVGAVATCLLPYAAGRRLPADGRVLRRLHAGSERYFTATGGLRGLIAARLAPTPPEPVSAAAGAGGVTVGAFVAGTLVGELPWTLAAVAIGASLYTFDPARAAVDWRLVAAIGLVGVALLAGPAYRAWAA